MKRFNLKEKEKRIVYVVAILFFIVIAYYAYTCFTTKVCEVDVINKLVRHDITITAPHGAIVAEVVDTKASRELGLSGRTGLHVNEGMLFVFDVSGKYGFWMKDMLFPIDIVWINQNGVIVKSESNLEANSYPNTFINDVDASYVLEVASGSIERYGLYLGSKVIIGE